LMTIVPPLVSEKIFVSIIVLLFAFAMWLYAASPPSALIGLLFTFNWLLQMGFYNHSLAVALFFIIIALWRRKRFVAEAALLVVCYFASPMMVLLAVGAILLLWLADRQLNPTQLLALVPVLPLIVWY